MRKSRENCQDNVTYRNKKTEQEASYLLETSSREKKNYPDRKVLLAFKKRGVGGRSTVILLYCLRILS